MKETLEREIKLTPGDGFVLPELGGERLPTRVFISTYHDTQDLRLARHGVTLRHRVEDGAGLWQLKLPRGAARLELELARAAGPAACRDARRCCRPIFAAATLVPSPGCGRAVRGCGRTVRRSSTTTSPCSKASA